MKILDNSGRDYEVINYLKNPPSAEELKSLANKMGVSAKDFIRKKESIFTELELKFHLDNEKYDLLSQYMTTYQ